MIIETYFSSFHIICILCLLINTVLVCYSKNSVHSVLFLIGAFINSVFILFIFQIEFMSLIFLFIYIGAIAVLFLFIIMMLPNKYEYIPIQDKILLLVAIICSFYTLFIYKNTSIKNLILININEFENLFKPLHLDNANDAVFFSLTLYNYNAILILIAGLILLVSMLGAILLTVELKTIYKAKKNTNSLSRSTKTIILYK